MKIKSLRGPAVALVVIAFLALTPAMSASAAGVATTTTFAETAPQTVDFGANWIIPIKVAAAPDSYYGDLGAGSGTVNVLIKGQPGNYATGLPLASNGIAYMSPPSAQRPLAAGTYELTAVFVPSGGTYLNSSQTATPATLTITPLDLAATFTTSSTTSADAATVGIAATVTPKGTTQGTPPGQWVATAKDPAGKTVASNKTTIAANQKSPVALTLNPTVKRGETYSISAVFTPGSDVAGGYTITNGQDQKLTIASETFGEKMSDPLAVPIWGLALMGVGLAALVAALIVLLVRRRSGSTKPETPQREAADPHTPTDDDSPLVDPIHATADVTTHSPSWSLGADEEDR
jgi:hypothetical protein